MVQVNLNKKDAKRVVGNAFAEIVRDFKVIRCDTVILDMFSYSQRHFC